MSSDQPLCLSSGSTDRPRIFTLRLSNSGFMAAIVPSSVVHTGVKSFGCENRTPQLSPRYSCRSIVPSVDSAVKLGASSPKRNAMCVPLVVVGFDGRLRPVVDELRVQKSGLSTPDTSLMFQVP